jgi:hypothetical protein
VADFVLQAVHDRVELGLQRYGTKLQTFNGRDALRDLTEELLDGVFYAFQMQLEQKAQRARLERLSELLAGKTILTLAQGDLTEAHGLVRELLA